MRKLRLLSLIVATFSVLFLFSCEKIDEKIEGSSFIPEKFSVDIPSSMSNNNVNEDSEARLNNATLDGNGIYLNMNLFIHVGEKSAEVVESIMQSIRQYDLGQELTIEFTSEEDGRVKRMTVVEGSVFEGAEYAYQMTIVDVNDEMADDGGLAMQVFWNTEPVDGVAVMKPYNINRRDFELHEEAMYRVDYSEKSAEYDAQMEVQIAGLPLVETDPYSIRALKMFVGKKGDVVDVRGNSNHPKARFLNDNQTGFNWAFVASGNDTGNYAVAEVGLPYSNTDSDNRSVLLEEFSIKNVFIREAKEKYPFLTEYSEEQLEAIWDAYFVNANAPGYFAEGEFVAGGTSPDEKYTALEARIEAMAPFNPSVISSLKIGFQE